MRAPSKHVPRAVALLAALHLCALVAEPVAPYPAGEQHREYSYAPPTRLHLVDGQGRWHRWPFVYATAGDRPGEYREDRSRMFPLKVLVKGRPYGLTPAIGWDRHLVGVDEPARLFLLGTDRYGRDILARLLAGARLSLFAGLIAAALALALGALVGGVAGYWGGWLDGALVWLTGACLALPWVYLLLAARTLLPLDLPPGRAFLLTAALIGVVGWARPALLIRAVTIGARDQDYALAARACGASTLRVLVRHVLPQSVGVAVTQAAIMTPRFVLAEITLSFLGLGVSEPAASWGTLTAAMIPPALVLAHWWLAAPLVAIVGIFALYDLAARELERRPVTTRD